MSETVPNYPYYPIDMCKNVLVSVQNCQVVCENSYAAVLGMQDCCMRAAQLQLLRDCADICALTAKYVARCSMFAKSLAASCAQICDICGNQCLKQPDSQSQYCGQYCLNCAKECKAFAGMGTPHPDYGYPGPISPGSHYPGCGFPSMPCMCVESEKKDNKKNKKK